MVNLSMLRKAAVISGAGMAGLGPVAVGGIKLKNPDNQPIGSDGELNGANDVPEKKVGSVESSETATHMGARSEPAEANLEAVTGNEQFLSKVGHAIRHESILTLDQMGLAEEPAWIRFFLEPLDESNVADEKTPFRERKLSRWGRFFSSVSLLLVSFGVLVALWLIASHWADYDRMSYIKGGHQIVGICFVAAFAALTVVGMLGLSFGKLDGVVTVQNVETVLACALFCSAAAIFFVCVYYTVKNTVEMAEKGNAENFFTELFS